MQKWEQFEKGWQIHAGGLELVIEIKTGSLSRLVTAGKKDVLRACAREVALGVTSSEQRASENDFMAK